MTEWNRINEELERQRKGWKWLADKLGVSIQVVHNWKSRGVPAKSYRAIGDAIGKSIDWIEGLENGHSVRDIVSDYNVAPYRPRARVPLISEVQAGELSDIDDNQLPGHPDEWVEADTSMPTKCAFALRVTGESMMNPAGEPSFPEGTIIIVDPGRQAGPNDYVVAKDVVTQRATFKKLVTDGGRWFLRPLNPAYPMQEIDDPSIRVIGRVIEYKRSGKL